MPTESPEATTVYCDHQLLADTALVVEALAAFAGNPCELKTLRKRRAWELISELAADLGMTPREILAIDMHDRRR
jgi:hypothetical protein